MQLAESNELLKNDFNVERDRESIYHMKKQNLFNKLVEENLLNLRV